MAARRWARACAVSILASSPAFGNLDPRRLICFLTTLRLVPSPNTLRAIAGTSFHPSAGSCKGQYPPPPTEPEALTPPEVQPRSLRGLPDRNSPSHKTWSFPVNAQLPDFESADCGLKPCTGARQEEFHPPSMLASYAGRLPPPPALTTSVGGFGQVCRPAKSRTEGVCTARPSMGSPFLDCLPPNLYSPRYPRT